MKTNYDLIFQDIISKLDHKPKLLLHSCCGPCSTAVIDTLKDYFDITILYYNPNIEPEEEYEKRKQEQIRLIKELGFINYLDCDYDNLEFLNTSKGLEKEKEGGARCSKCFYLRMSKTAKEAKDNNFEYFGTTLTVSPHKNSQVINEIGKQIEEELDIKYLYGDFKKHNGYLKSIELAKKYNLYRQDYCGCHFSNWHNIEE